MGLRSAFRRSYAWPQDEPLVWFVFPQSAGLGLQLHVPAVRHLVADEAKAYLEHPVLGRASESAWES